MTKKVEDIQISRNVAISSPGWTITTNLEQNEVGPHGDAPNSY